MATREEMATEVVKSWISGKSGNSELLAREIKEIYAAMIEAFNEAAGVQE